jgi:small-conductance mechanosensitive channel
MEPFLAEYGLDGALWLATMASSIFLFSVAIAIIFNKLLVPPLLRFADWTPTSLDSRILRGLRMPLTLAIVALGAYLALVLPFDLEPARRSTIDIAAGLLATLLGAYAVASLVGHACDWYLAHAAKRAESSLGQRMMPLFRRVLVGLIYGVGVLMIIDQLGRDITPLIAGMGLGGLAVALALQPTLANLFAGSYVMTEGAVKPGDYVELESGEAGYVLDVSWRSTRIRTFYNNLVIVPNSRFAETIIINYQAPTPAVNIIVSAGVSLDSDFYHVEQVCREVMDEVLETSPYGVKEFGAWFGFDSFGESNVNFWLFVQAKDRIASFGLRTDLMSRLRERFREEGIIINYPVRSLQLAPGMRPEEVMRRQRSRGAVNGREQRPQRRRSPRREARHGVHLPPDMGEGPEGAPGGPGRT